MEFLLVGLLLTALTLAVLQLALALYLRNLTHDAAIEGAYHAALADVAPGEGAERARDILNRAIGADFVSSSAERRRSAGSGEVVEVTVVATLPLVGILGIPDGWEVTAHAPRATFDG